jgi:hypothetical protein
MTLIAEEPKEYCLVFGFADRREQHHMYEAHNVGGA